MPLEQDSKMLELTGKVLIAHPNLQSPFFKKSVIYIIEHNTAQGSQGIVLNKPSRFPVNTLFKNKGLELDDPSTIHKGGPINEKAVSLFHTGEWTSTNTYPVGPYSVSSDDFMIEKMANGDAPVYWRMFGGIAGWGPGQLEAEVEGAQPFGKSWLTIPANDAILFEHDGDDQWNKALEYASQLMVDHYF